MSTAALSPMKNGSVSAGICDGSARSTKSRQVRLPSKPRKHAASGLRSPRIACIFLDMLPSAIVWLPCSTGMEIDEEQTGPLALEAQEVRGFRFEVAEDSLHFPGHAAVGDSLVALLHRYGHLEHHTHGTVSLCCKPVR